MHADDDEATIEAVRLDDAFEELPPPRPRRRLTPLTGGLLAVLLVACGFVGGVLVEKGQSASPAGVGAASCGFAAAPAARAGGAGGGGRGGGGSAGGGRAGFGGGAAGAGGAGAATVGQVTTVDGDTLYVTDPQGNTLKVTAAKGATVTRQVDSRVRAIRPGETVIVQGAARKGAILATSIRATPGVGAGGRGAGRAGGAGGVVDQLFGGGGTSSKTTEAP